MKNLRSPKITKHPKVDWWKRLKYVLFFKRPVPLFSRKTCLSCSFIFNTDLYRECPSCGWGESTVWVLSGGGEIHGIFRDPKKAQSERKALEFEGYPHLTVESWKITDL